MHITAIHKKAIDQYYRDLATYREQNVTHETAVRSAFQNLLASFAPSVNWTLIPEEPLANGKRPDGTLRDTFRLPRGYWEAKDTKDDLPTEIRKKTAIGYPTTNTIFEDTRRAILYQNNKLAFEADLTQRDQLLDLLRQFFTYTEPDIATFEAAVDEFKQRIPDLAHGLLTRITEEHAQNATFVRAFYAFLELCRTSLNPQISRATVDEMLVQHLLTERLFRTIFQNPDFINRNVIAAEIEKVIRALTSRSFNRNDFEKSLDRFYVAIEGAARTLDNWTEKQHFLDTVYERFFQGFSIKQADTHGIVYTPQEIVEFMVASVEEVLQREFSTSLSTPGVQVLDPCVGTGNFIVHILRRISGSTLTQKYASDLFCNEIMLLPYYIASLNIEHAYYERTGEYRPFEGICFADTLELAEGQQPSLFVEENTERVQREKSAPIMVVIGNPPYNVGQVNENDNNKNRKYPVIDRHIRNSYAKDSKATLNAKLYDAYVKFFRWATDRLEERDGIICFVSNNSFIHNIGCDGMRQHLEKDFTDIYHLDLGGNARRQGGGSVFGIRVGVGITILVRHRSNQSKYTTKSTDIFYFKLNDEQSGSKKLAQLGAIGNIAKIDWQVLHPDEKHTWITEGLQSDFSSFLPVGSKETKLASSPQAICKTYSLGATTNRDEWMYDFDKSRLTNKLQRFIYNYNSEVFRWTQINADNNITFHSTEAAISYLDNFVNNDPAFLKWTDRLKEALNKRQMIKLDASKFRQALYRPFCKQYLYFDHLLNQRRYRQHFFFPCPESDNVAICCTVLGSEKPFMTLATNIIPDLHLVGPGAGAQCFPYYTYAEDGSNRRENITDWALAQFQAQYGQQVTKWHIFHYIYAMLHHPQYRERYAENLKRELPRIPLLKQQAAFDTCVQIGKQLMELHLNYEQAPEYPLTWHENRDVPVNWYIKKMKLSPDKSSIEVNDWLTLANIPPHCFQYRLGNRSALEWVIDQYQLSTDKRSTITTDPNRLDDQQYIVRLLGKVITVSIETVSLLENLIKEVKQETWER